MALKLNEGRACEAIVRHLEKREKDTGIEPFEGHMKMEAQADQRFTPIIDGLNGELDTKSRRRCSQWQQPCAAKFSGPADRRRSRPASGNHGASQDRCRI